MNDKDFIKLIKRRYNIIIYLIQFTILIIFKLNEIYIDINENKYFLNLYPKIGNLE